MCLNDISNTCGTAFNKSTGEPSTANLDNFNWFKNFRNPKSQPGTHTWLQVQPEVSPALAQNPDLEYKDQV